MKSIIKKFIFLFIILTISIFLVSRFIMKSTELENEQSIYINGNEIVFSNTGKLNSKNAEQLSTDTENTLLIKDIYNIEGLMINDQNVDVTDEEINFNVQNISKKDKIKISILYKDSDKYLDFYINTLSTDFPGYDVTANSPYEGDYYLTTHSEEYNYVFKLNNEGNLIFYKQVPSNAFDFKKIITSDNKVRYGYLLTDNSLGRISGVGYSPTRLIILDENYNEIKNITMGEYKDVEEGEPLDNHDYIYIDDNHYIITSYKAVEATNIPQELSKGNTPKVAAAVLQEVKDGEVIWQWTSTDYEEFYETSVEYNTFSEDSEAPLDYVHFNSITIDPNDNNLVVSFRHTDSVIKIDRNSGDIIWTLGGKADDFSLSDEQKFSRQHFARFTEDGYLTIYDNGVENEDTRVVKLKIDEENKKVVDFKSYDVEEFYKYTGSVQELDAENEVFLIGVGTQIGAGQDLVAIEKNYSTGEVYFKFSFDSGSCLYRVYKG